MPLQLCKEYDPQPVHQSSAHLQHAYLSITGTMRQDRHPHVLHGTDDMLCVQARDLLQHLWTGPISNSPVDIVQGSKSVEVRPVGVSKVRSSL